MGTPGDYTFNSTGSVQTVTVVSAITGANQILAGTYDITAYGAQGGGSNGNAGGDGAEIGGQFTLTDGEVLTIAVGGQGVAGGFDGGGGGGGGSFVIETNSGSGTVDNNLVIAGGGGGAGYYSGGGAASGGGGQITTSGHNGYTAPTGSYGGAGGIGGSPGTHAGGGGGGYNGGNGGDYNHAATAGTGRNAGHYAGGAGYKNGSYTNGNGGFGGGGGGGTSGGGGGGYGGGGGGGGYGDGGGGGGGSVDSGTPVVAVAGENTGNGMVTIDTATPCYCPGTLILTDRGEVPVEDLAIGDVVATASGPLRPIKWIGRRGYGGRFIAGQPLMLPVCVKQGALENNVPARDLWVSPGHAICLDGVLVPAWLLVNGVSVIQAERVESVTYIHVELDDHDIIFAENCPAESFIDDHCRNQFHNAAEFDALYPDRDAGWGGLCLPRIEDGFHLQAIQRRLALRAGAKIASEQGGPLRGYVDRAGPEVVSGWAQSETHPEVPVCLDIVVDGKRVMRALANRYRADLRAAGLGSGKHGFEARLPAGVCGRVEVRRSADHSCLALTEAAAALAA